MKLLFYLSSSDPKDKLQLQQASVVTPVLRSVTDEDRPESVSGKNQGVRDEDSEEDLRDVGSPDQRSRLVSGSRRLS